VRHVKAVLAIAALAAGGAGLLALRGMAAQAEVRSQAETYAAAGAKLVCSCVHVGGRDAETCRRDTLTDLGALTITDEDNVTQATSLGGRVIAMVRFEPGLGCMPVKP
jgi:hypothetical protein